MAGHASRWDARYLKAYEALANHRYNLTTFAVEPNVWGASSAGRGTVSRRLVHLAKAAGWLDEHCDRLRVEGPIPASSRRRPMTRRTDARIVEGASQRLAVPAASLDAVVTDPPYADDVQYAELSDLFRAWADIPTGALVGDAIVGRLRGPNGTDAYRRLLTDVFTEIHRALRPGGHLVLSYANREPTAWAALFTALQDAGFVAVGYQIVVSENERDNAKIGKRSCTFDVLLDLVHAGTAAIRRSRPKSPADGEEAAFCRIVGEQALRIGRLTDGWVEPFCERLRSTPFLRASKKIADR
jgi:adenine-specific DNA methylase